MTDQGHYDEEDVVRIAKVAGSSVSPENAKSIAANLSALRVAVLRKARNLPDDLAPILVMDPRWEARK
jgi:hypothetical protein